MEISSVYDSAKTENKWYQYWMDQGFFRSQPDDREPYTIVIPPPNVTGQLHMGHMLNNTIQDVLIRRARMMGKNACWVPGTDHASIATEAKVVKKLKDQGIEKADLTRDEFLEHAWEWKEKHGGIILNQLQKLGASCDWERTRFTMEDDLSDAVIETFVDLFEKGLIYRGFRMVNWDPEALTAVSDEEVEHVEETGQLCYVRYAIEGEDDQWLTIATTRPETILADTAICINPDDERYKHLHGKRAIVPFTNRSIPIIEDSYVEMEFGTGCLKVTPAHDPNDQKLGEKHELDVIDMLNENGTLNQHGGKYEGLDRFVARKQMTKDLDEAGHLEKAEPYLHKVGRSERTKAVIEPKISVQWFVRMEALAKPALDHVMDDTVQFYPSKFKNVYRHWMENVRDWCISRQLWWGQRIPAYYYGDGMNDFVVAKTAEEALQLANEKTDGSLALDDLRQDEDVVDTWFSSWLWPISVFDGFKDPNNADIQYYYPTSSLVTGHDIIFFWVARMIMAGYAYKGVKPFSSVYFTGMVRDSQRRKMSKQLGNSPDPLDLIDQFGADGVRVGMLLSSPAGNDLLFDDQLCLQGRNFSNKIWNAFRLVKSWEIDESADQPAACGVAKEWFASKLNEAIVQLEDHYSKFRMSDALMTTYKLVWDDFCSWYLELVKPAYQQPADRATYVQTIHFLEELLKLLHPFMPFLTEEIWHLITERAEKDCVIVADWPTAGEVNEQLLKDFDNSQEVISEVRNIRKKHEMSPKEVLGLVVKTNSAINKDLDESIIKLANLSGIDYEAEKPAQGGSFIVNSNEYFVPLDIAVDVEAERTKLSEELKYAKGFLLSVEKKLGNERFVNNAPKQVVENEQKKKQDAESKIKVLEAQLADLS